MAAFDLDTYVRDVADAMVVNIERAFARADLRDGGPSTTHAGPILARSRARKLVDPESEQEGWIFPSERQALLYDWISSLLTWGARGKAWTAIPGLAEAWPTRSREEMLGKDVHGLAFHAREEVFNRWKGQHPIGGALRFPEWMDPVLEAVRARLNWPTPEKYNSTDPPPPNRWPAWKEDF